MRIAVIGSGVSGIAAAVVLQREGHEVRVFEREPTLGGVWAKAYPEVRLQNVWTQYRLSELDWPTRPDDNPTAPQILAYFEAAIAHYQVDVRFDAEVVGLDELPAGWRVSVRGPEGLRAEEFDYVIVAVGQYTQPKAAVTIADRERFAGVISTERDIDDLSALGGQRLVVVGYGKSAVDLAALAAARGARVELVLRKARWLIPEKLAGLMHFKYALFNRINSVMIPAWAHPTAAARFLHARLAFVVRGFWAALSAIVRAQYRAAALGHGPEARARIRVLLPEHSLVSDMRSAAALEPRGFYAAVARGEINPRLGTARRFTEDALVLDDGTELACDQVILCLGSGSPVFPFMPLRYRELLESEPDGAQLYRHLIHPRIPRLAFAGYNHGFMHLPAVEVGMLWLSAVLRGELELPSVEAMEASIERVRAWKREHVNFEPSRSCAINTRFHQYLDILLLELGISPYRKRNLLAEIFDCYEAGDYAGLGEDYRRARAAHPEPRKVLDLDT